MEEIIITINTKGEVTTQTKGYSGSACMKADEFIRNGFGTVLSDKKTSEYYGNEISSEVVQIVH